MRVGVTLVGGLGEPVNGDIADGQRWRGVLIGKGPCACVGIEMRIRLGDVESDDGVAASAGAAGERVA